MLHLNRYKWVPILLLSFAAIAVALLVIYPLMPVWAVAAIMCLVGHGHRQFLSDRHCLDPERGCRISRSASPWAR